MKLKNKNILITGSSAGIGKAVALAFANEGSNIIINGKSNRKNGLQVVEEIKKLGVKAVYIQADVSDEKEVSQLFIEALKNFSTIDILVNNAGVAAGKPFIETTKAYWLEQFNSNFFGTVLCSKEAIKIMKQNGGKILNTASVRGLPDTGREGIIAYSAAKAAVINFTKTLAKEVAPKIMVNAVAPGFTLTRNYDEYSEALKQSFLDSTLLKRWITPDEIADAFIYLAKSDAVTGEILVVDGGFVLK